MSTGCKVNCVTVPEPYFLNRNVKNIELLLDPDTNICDIVSESTRKFHDKRCKWAGTPFNRLVIT
jgi:hypothetical protein